MKILGDLGIEAITMRQLSNSLGVSKTAPYRHFENKSALLAAVAAEGFRRMSISLEERPNADLPESDLAIIMERYITFATMNPRLYKLMFGKEVFRLPVSAELSETASEAYSGVKAILSTMESEEEPTVNINTAWALVHGLSLLINDNLLAVDENGNTEHALLAGGDSPTPQQIARQISSAIAAIVSGFSVNFP
ncbi:MAG: TetR/AcrR family transcriptional regulator [Candidatus Sabulitectum sp.]|nr:TetR/AcrR family transcriptional regulator [Candidatus Sabulitectum sp.]